MRILFGVLFGLAILWVEAIVWDWWQRRKDPK